MPGNPIQILYRNPALTQAQILTLQKEFGLDQPIWVQYGLFIVNSLQGQFGISIYYRQPVSGVLFPALVNSMVLLVPATFLSILLGIGTGKLAAWRRGSLTDAVTTGLSMALYSIPTFWLGGIFILFAVYIGGIPVFGMETIPPFTNPLEQAVDILSHLLLPLATLTIVLFGEFTIIMRNALIDILSEDYIVFARSKGASDRRIMQRHAYPNAQLPMISIIAVNVGLVVGGAILTEVVFSWPGVGLLIYNSITSRDYPILQAAFLVVAISVVVANLVADLLYGVFDPRIRYA